MAFALVATGIGLIYYFAPDADQDFAWITPGSLIATTLWLLASLAFRFYVVNFGNYETYRSRRRCHSVNAVVLSLRVGHHSRC